MRKGEELKAPRYASAAVTRDYITTHDIIPNNYLYIFLFTELGEINSISIFNII